MKRTSFIANLAVLAGISLVSAPIAFAVNNPVTRMENKMERVEERVENRMEKREATGSVKLDKFENKIASRVGAMKNFIDSHGFIKDAKVTAIAGTTFTVSDKDGKTITVNTDSKTRLRRRFYGQAVLSEITVGHIINVYGKWTDDAHTTMLATQIRDESIQKRFGVFVGDVTAITGSTLTLKTINRGNQTVTVSTSTKFVDRREKAITQAAVVVGHRIMVKGMWDNVNNTVTEVKFVKDFSLPVRPVTSPTPAVTAVPTAAVTPPAGGTPTATATPQAGGTPTP